LIAEHRTFMVQLIWCLWLRDLSWLMKIGPPQGIQLKMKRRLHRPTDCYMNGWE